MYETKRRLSAIVVLTSVLVLGVLALSTGIASEDSATLNDWNGTWLNLGTMLDDPAMDVVYEAMTDAANAAAGDGTFTTDDAKSFLYAMHESNFGDLGIAGNNVTYYNTDGTVKCDCEYESAGVETVAFGEEEFNWYRFALTSEDTTCSEYRYLIFTEVHSHEEGMVHWHMRYGNTSFDDLINNTSYAIWYPTFAVEGTTMETVADGYAEGAEMMGGMMLAGQDPWKDFDPNHLPTQIIDLSGEYICTNEAMYLDMEGDLLTEFSPPYQEEGGEWTFEQHGSLLKVILVEEGEELGFFYGSTAGDNIMLAWEDYLEIIPGMGMMRFETIWTGKVHCSGEEIVMNAIMRGYDSENNLVLHLAGTQVLERVED
jgi:Zn/Cd-binding protein ZinT